MNRLINRLKKIKELFVSKKKIDGYELFHKYMSEDDYKYLIERIKNK
ncbi:TPA: hypothetical protein KQG29_001459 [Clostridioides difficile]|nr:hypothetical protein [Clostridioides sp. ZZV15-6597]HBF1820669.1 hypothetical protein [Clostridioides difficile]HBG5344095.1 hypothetical protein [Clostridioides difficile]